MTDMLDEVRKAVAEISGFDKDWPSHGNAALAITAAYSLLKTDRDTAEQRGYERGVREATKIILQRGQSNTGAVHPSSLADAEAVQAMIPQQEGE